jgi:hypothetical protein
MPRSDASKHSTERSAGQREHANATADVIDQDCAMIGRIVIAGLDPASILFAIRWTRGSNPRMTKALTGWRD